MQVTQNIEGRFYKDGERYDIIKEENDEQLPFQYAKDNGYILYNKFVRQQERWAEQSEILKAKKIKQIADFCNAEYMSDLVTSDDIPFRTHLEAIIDVNTLIEMLAPEQTFIGYKCADGIFRDITREQFETALNEGIARKVAAFTKRKILVEAVENANSIQELNQIQW